MKLLTIKNQRNFKNTILIMVFLLSSDLIYAQLQYPFEEFWKKEGDKLEATQDGGHAYLINGINLYPAKDIMGFAKVDAQGNTEFEALFRASNEISEYSRALDIVETNDGYILVSLIKDFGSPAADRSDSTFGGTDLWVIKTDKKGLKIWDKVFGGSGFDGAHSKFINFANGSPNHTGSNIIDADIEATKDGGFLIATSSESDISGNKQASKIQPIGDTWVIKIDKLGNKLWDQTYNNLSPSSQAIRSTVRSLKVTPDNGFVLATTTTGFALQDSIGFSMSGVVIKCNSSGDKEWSKLIKPFSDSVKDAGSYYISVVDIELTDNGYMVAGRVSYNHINNKTLMTPVQSWILKLNKDGFSTTRKIFGTASGHNYVTDLEKIGNKWLLIMDSDDVKYNNCEDVTGNYAIPESPKGAKSRITYPGSISGGLKSYNKWIVCVADDGGQLWDLPVINYTNNIPAADETSIKKRIGQKGFISNGLAFDLILSIELPSNNLLADNLIDGPHELCINETGTYSINTNASSLVWQSSGFTQLSHTNNSITVKPSGAGVGKLYGYIGSYTNGLTIPERCVTKKYEPLPVPQSILGPSVVCRLEEYIYSVNPVAGATSYTWETSDPAIVLTPIGNGTSCKAEISGGGATNFTLKVKANGNCGSSVFANRTILKKSPGQAPCNGNDAVSDNNDVHVYPNPANTEFSLKLNEEFSGPVTIQLVDNMSGKLVKQVNVTSNDMKINTRDLKAGIYIMKVISGDKQVTQKIQVVK